MAGTTVSTSQGPVPNVMVPWSLQTGLIKMWIQVPSHAEVPGKERADVLAEMGRRAAPLYATVGEKPQRLFPLSEARP